MDRFLAMLLK